jgi:hypothetical protein
MNFGSLTPAEIAALRALPGGTGYVARLECAGPRGRRFRPIRGDVFRTPELAELRRRYVGGRQLEASAAVYMVDASGDAVEVDDVEIPVLPARKPERSPSGRTASDLLAELDTILARSPR